MSLTSVTRTFYKHKYPVLMGISYLILNLSLFFIRVMPIPSSSSSEDKNFYYHPILMTWIMFLAKSFIFIFYIIKRCRTKEQKNHSVRITKTNLFFWMLLLWILDSFATTTTSILRETHLSFFELAIKGLFIFFSTMISIYKLGYKYYKHHYLGIIVIAIGIVIYTVNDIITNFDDIKKLKKNVIIYALITICVQISIAGQECSEKYLMHYKYIYHFLLISLEGFVGTFFCSISFIPTSIMDCPDNVYFCSNEYPTHKQRKIEPFIYTMSYIFKHPRVLVMIIAVLLSMISFESFRILTNQRFSPGHRSIADVYGAFLEFIIMSIFQYFGLFKLKPEKISFYVVSVIGYAFILVGVLIYLEIVIIHILGLDVNTEDKIEERAMKDRNTNENTVDSINLLEPIVNEFIN